MDPYLKLKLLSWRILLDPSLCHREKHKVQTLRGFVIFINTLTQEKSCTGKDYEIIAKVSRAILVHLFIFSLSLIGGRIVPLTSLQSAAAGLSACLYTAAVASEKTGIPQKNTFQSI